MPKTTVIVDLFNTELQVQLMDLKNKEGEELNKAICDIAFWALECGVSGEVVTSDGN